ncbi:hypothetical protein AB0B89_35920, partial [Sphaerisporangium sp. NPDC049002]
AVTATPVQLNALNSRYHKAGLGVFTVIVLAHCAEHIAQAIQIWVLGWPLPEARGVLGVPFPWLVNVAGASQGSRGVSGRGRRAGLRAG